MHIKKNVVVYILVVVIIAVIGFMMKGNRANTGYMKSYVDRFLNCLQNDSSDIINKRYAVECYGDKASIFLRKLDTLNIVFGKPSSYMFANMREFSKSQFGDVDTYVLTYEIKFAKAGECFGHFIVSSGSDIKLFDIDIIQKEHPLGPKKDLMFSIRYLSPTL